MKKLIAIGLLTSSIICTMVYKSFALSGHIDNSKVGNADYIVQAGSIGVNMNGSIVFRAHATDYEFKVQGSTALISATFFLDGTTMTINPGTGGTMSDAVSNWFFVPAASPTIVTYSLFPGSTMYYRLGGVKTDR